MPSLDAIAKAHDALKRAEATVAERRTGRDDLIRAAVAEGTSMYSIAKRLGLSNQAVHLIAKPRA